MFPPLMLMIDEPISDEPISDGPVSDQLPIPLRRSPDP